jgi:hypothetical protein
LAASTLTARNGVGYYNTGVAGTSPLLFLVDFGEDKSSSAEDFKIQWPTGYILR